MAVNQITQSTKDCFNLFFLKKNVQSLKYTIR